MLDQGVYATMLRAPGPFGSPPPWHVDTSAYRAYVQFATQVRANASVGVCYSEPGAGLSTAARRHASWDTLLPALSQPGACTDLDPCVFEAQTIVINGGDVSRRIRDVRLTLSRLMVGYNTLMLRSALRGHVPALHRGTGRGWVRLIVVDDAWDAQPRMVDELCSITRRASIGLLLLAPTRPMRQHPPASRYEEILARRHPARAWFGDATVDELHTCLVRLDGVGMLWPSGLITDSPSVLSTLATASGRRFGRMQSLRLQVTWLAISAGRTRITTDLVEAACCASVWIPPPARSTARASP